LEPNRLKVNPIPVGKICSIRDDCVSRYFDKDADRSTGDRLGIINEVAAKPSADHLNVTSHNDNSPQATSCLGGLLYSGEVV